MVFATLVIGGITRLTHAGLSIVEWQPLVGAIPPMSESDWRILFEKYRQTPEFREVNQAMDLAGFQYIFWWEWAHRLSGRLIGIVFLLPYLWFLARGVLRGSLAWKVLGFFVLGGLQGAMGWYMVKSGLVDDPRVSQYRLAAHLGLAFLIFGLMLWTALGLLGERRRALPGSSLHRVQGFGTFLVALVFVMVLTGALVAGIRAGLAYNTFPSMNGHFVPPEILMLEPWWLNFFANMATVQFDHRMIAWALLGLIPVLWWLVRCHGPAAAYRPANLLAGMLAVQVALGIATLLLKVPVPLAAAHQAGAMVLFGLLVWTNHALRTN